MRPMLQSNTDIAAMLSGVQVITKNGSRPTGWTCHYCGRTFSGQGRKANKRTVDHIVPKVWGGQDAWWNFVLSCQSCNLEKVSEWPDCECLFCRRAKLLWMYGARRAGFETIRAKITQQYPGRPKPWSVQIMAEGANLWTHRCESLESAIAWLPPQSKEVITS